MDVSAAPALPAPRTPSAVPCWRSGNHTAEKAMPTAKEEPANPKPSPPNINPQKLSAKLSRKAPPAVSSITMANTGRPPKRSVSIPAGRRKIAPVSTGMPINQAISILSKS